MTNWMHKILCWLGRHEEHEVKCFHKMDVINIDFDMVVMLDIKVYRCNHCPAKRYQYQLTTQAASHD